MVNEKWSVENLILLSNESNSRAEVLEKLGLSLKAGNYRTLKKYFKEYGISEDIFKGKTKRYGSKQKYSDDDIFCEHSQYSSAHLKERILKSNLLEYKCKCCGNIGEWMGEKLVLQLDHINGINDDNRIENLRFLCPNCHAQTNTFSIGSRKLGKKEKKLLSKEEISIIRRKHERPNINILIDEIKTLGYVGTGKKYGVSDNSIRKWVKSYNLDPKKINK